mmetsp:Transcript_25615/g.67131  ORF Transcript_25615/g.67131 Transcript_25615/m.67131 type:complete len:144 (+) Transcript_25615:409-840(+)
MLLKQPPNCDLILHTIISTSSRSSLKLTSSLTRLKQKGYTALHRACLAGRGIIIGALLKAGADANAIDNYGNTPLHHLVRILAKTNSPDQSGIKDLLSHGADLCAKDKDGDEPIHIAVQGLSLTVVHTLTNAGANINAVNKVM